MKEIEDKIMITEISLNLVNEIISSMEGNSFHNHYHILYDLCNSLNKQKIKYLEIGAYCGGSASLISTNKNVTEVYSIDIGYPIPQDIPIKNVNKFKHRDCIYEYIKGDSTTNKTVDYVLNKINEIDILFIDGDHKYNAVISDFNNFKNLVNRGGYIVFDDYLDKIHSPEVFDAVNSIVRNLNLNEYQVIGSLKYELLKKTNQPNLESSNEFILLKK